MTEQEFLEQIVKLSYKEIPEGGWDTIALARYTQGYLLGFQRALNLMAGKKDPYIKREIPAEIQTVIDDHFWEML